jgi:hypothetical protein
MYWLIPIAIPVAFLLLSRLFPFTAPVQYYTAPGREQLKKQYGKWELFAMIVLFAATVFGAWVFGCLLKWLYTREIDPKAIFELRPGDWIFFIVAAVISFGLSWFLVEALFKACLKQRYADYLLYQS